MKRRRASYTAELAFLMPILLFTLFAPVYLGYEMYTRTKEASKSGWEEEFDAQEGVRKIKCKEAVIKEAL